MRTMHIEGLLQIPQIHTEKTRSEPEIQLRCLSRASHNLFSCSWSNPSPGGPKQKSTFVRLCAISAWKGWHGEECDLTSTVPFSSFTHMDTMLELLGPGGSETDI
ncbi:uncharacterized protein AKAW2_21016S [Aspergillus luchuensis]|uniref:Uncharacterized protein n=1 Tax=Aspergillus kawachii TaxID=1069201 RepID=A0A7R7W4D9_ASPKA|nr:uncharacterized protein AKAW2_21016S [Aspergillus luchuensis]BCR96076.1 hypothetical protein AKAW2_21016S [Aspergillus luchuensis]